MTLDDRLPLFNFSCGFVAMAVAGVAAMTLGLGGMAWTAPWMERVGLCVMAECLLMVCMGQAPALMLLAPVLHLAEGMPRVERAATLVLRGLVFATAVVLALLLLRVIRSGA